jgi:hypothetical protein
MFIFLFGSCSSLKDVMVAEGDHNDAVQNAIHDFLNTVKFNKKDRVFAVSIKDINDEILGVSISRDVNTLLVITEDSVEFSYHGFPTRYFEQGGKLFYWDDSTKNVTDDLIATFTRYDLVDTMIVNIYIPERIIEHSIKGVDYYFCKDDLLKYKKVITRKAMGLYDPPKPKCKVTH